MLKYEEQCSNEYLTRMQGGNARKSSVRCLFMLNKFPVKTFVYNDRILRLGRHRTQLTIIYDPGIVQTCIIKSKGRSYYSRTTSF